jgi:hypothetical protein
MDDNKEMVNDLYNAALITVGAVGLSMLSKKALGEPLSTPQSVRGTLKLVVAVGLSTLAVKYLQGKGYVPKEIQKTPK